MTEIEAFLYGGVLPAGAVCVRKIGFADSSLSVSLVEVPSGTEWAVLTFPQAVVSSIWFDDTEAIEWPLDIMGFDCSRAGSSWKFVLNCSSVEFMWTAEWPSKTRR